MIMFTFARFDKKAHGRSKRNVILLVIFGLITKISNDSHFNIKFNQRCFKISMFSLYAIIAR